MTPASLPLIDVDRLQVGIYVVLELGWQNHPFLRSSFTLRSEQQLQQLRALGLKQVRYSPERSTAKPLAVISPDAEAEAAPEPPAPIMSVAAASAWVDVEPKTELQWQQESLQRIENEYSQLAQQHQALLRQLANDPAGARSQAERLGETLVVAAAESYEPAVRLLSPRIAAQASGHDVGVAALALLLARDCGFEQDTLKEVTLAALLHDIGKIGIPSFLHEDSTRLTEFERRSYRQHVQRSVELAKVMELSPAVIRAIAEHHELSDGNGFPARLRGEQISRIGRILAIVNRYMNLICPLHVESGLTPHQALQQMYRSERAHFDAALMSRFIRILGVYPPGTLVELTDRRMAIVIASRPGVSLSPRVQIIETPDDDQPGPAIDIESDGELRVHHSLPPALLNPKWAHRSRQLARTPFYIEPQTAPEWNAWSASDTGQTLVF